MPRLPDFPSVTDSPIRLLIGPTNSAGQGLAWARSAQSLPDVTGTAFALRRGGRYGFADDYGVPIEIFGHPRWQRAQRRYVLTAYTHVLVESMRPLLGSGRASDASADIERMAGAGLRVGLVFHGSDIRLPSRHAERERWSPFHRADDLTERLERQARRFSAAVQAHPGPVFVSTPDLLLDVPAAQWLPVTIDPARWQLAAVPVMERRRPVVVHAPSNPLLKGSAVIETAMSDLAARGVVEYRRIDGVPHDRMPWVIGDADVVIDQLLMGLYGVAACEAMAAGRVVVSYVGDTVRSQVRTRTGLEVPIVEADPETLPDVVASLVADRDGSAERALEGIRFVDTVHDGRRSTEALRVWLTQEENA
ncbi:MAG TPA: hypothetical protein VEK80_13020, partial [Kribbellaceae bacterium]|nr:hypothetical protein [Kribbellaceae bacterium]